MSMQGVGESLQFPSGAIARVQVVEAHERFINAAEPAWISLKMHEIRKLLKRDETASSWAPEGSKVITTSTITDSELDGYPLKHEAQLINAFKPALHIGGDISVYSDFPRQRRAELIQEYVENALLLEEATDETTIIPLIKGFTPEEREICYRGLEYFDHDYVAYYVSQSYSSSRKNRNREIIADLQHISSCTDANIIILGLLGPQLEKFPPNVVASAGFFRWYNRVNLDQDSDTVLGREWEEIQFDTTDRLFK